MNSSALSAAALFYLVSATLSAAALFLLVELVKRTSVRDRRNARMWTPCGGG